MKSRMWRRTWCCVVAAWAAVAPWANGQGPAHTPIQTPTQTPTQPPTLKLRSRLVVLDAVVLDRDGHVVTTVPREAFSITEDKVPQRIASFEPPDAHRMPSAGPAVVVASNADLPKIGNAPVNVLVFDEVNTPFLQLAFAREQMEKYLQAQPELLPVPTLFLAVGARKIAVLHDYTQSRAELLASVKTHTADLDFTTVLAGLNGGASGAENGLVQTLGGLGQIAASLRGIPGRKNVIWVGSGYRRAEDLNKLSEADRDKVLDAVKTVTDRLLAARVTFYVIDPEGVASAAAGNGPDENGDAGGPAALNLTGKTDRSRTSDGAISFESFATGTGGRVIGGRNDLRAQLAEVSAEGTEYYTLSYVPTSSDDTARPFRRIEVTTNIAGLRVITREGYFAGEKAVSEIAVGKRKQPQDIRYDLITAARTTMTYDGLHAAALVAKGGFTLLVNAPDLHFEPLPDGARITELTVVAVFYNGKGKELGQHAAELKQRLEEAEVVRPESRIGLDFPAPVPAGTARVRFVLRDAATGVLGSADLVP